MLTYQSSAFRRHRPSFYVFECMSLTKPGIRLVSFTDHDRWNGEVHRYRRYIRTEMHKEDTQWSISNGPHMWGIWPGSPILSYIYVTIHSGKHTMQQFTWHSRKQNVAIERPSLQNGKQNLHPNLHALIGIITLVCIRLSSYHLLHIFIIDTVG